MKLTARRLVAFLLLIALSVGFGFAFDAIATAVERHRYPMVDSLSASVAANAEEFGVPDAILWALMKTGSDFASNAVSEDGRIGLMQLSPETFSRICTDLLETEPMNAGMLYEPETNLRAGSAWISYLYQRYGIWEIAFAAYYAGTDRVDAWLLDPDNTDGGGGFSRIPDQSTAKFVKRVTRAVDFYTTLYYE